jgi:hypothetical protein
MSDRGREPPPPRGQDNPHSYPYPPSQRDDEQERSGGETPRGAMAPRITLPSIQDAPYSSYPPQPPSRGYPSDPRASSGYNNSPSSVNGYQAPGPRPAILPPLQAGDPRSPTYPSPDPRDDYQRHQPAAYHQDPYYNSFRPPGGQYPPGPYSQHPPPGGYGQPPNGGYPQQGYPPPPHGSYPEYRGGHASVPPPPQMQQAAPRQRTSIACRYCRKRKVCNMESELAM